MLERFRLWPFPKDDEFPRTSVLFCTASFYNSSVKKKKTLLQDAVTHRQSIAILTLQNSVLLSSVKIAIPV